MNGHIKLEELLKTMNELMDEKTIQWTKYITGIDMNDVKTLIEAFKSKNFKMIAYVACIAIYNNYMSMLEESIYVHEERLIIEEACKEAIKEIIRERNEMKALADEYLSRHISLFQDTFATLDEVILSEDINGYLMDQADIQELLGHVIQFKNQDEFDLLMESDEDFKL